MPTLFEILSGQARPPGAPQPYTGMPQFSSPPPQLPPELTPAESPMAVILRALAAQGQWGNKAQAAIRQQGSFTPGPTPFVPQDLSGYTPPPSPLPVMQGPPVVPPAPTAMPVPVPMFRPQDVTGPVPPNYMDPPVSLPPAIQQLLAGAPTQAAAPASAPASVDNPVQGPGVMGKGKEVLQAIWDQLKRPADAESPLVRDVAGALGLPGSKSPSMATNLSNLIPGPQGTLESASDYIFGKKPEMGPPMPMQQNTAPPGVGTMPWTWPGATAGATAGSSSITIGGGGGGGAAPSGDAKSLLQGFLRQKEGFREQTYFDVNHHRVGYGSDTITMPDGTVREVKKGDTVTREDAERDLARRTDSVMLGIKSEIGEEAFNKLGPGGQAALGSVYYNYGSLPKNVLAAAQAGDSQAVAQAIAARAGDNGGVNAKRRIEEASMVAGAPIGGGQTSGNYGLPNAPTYAVPQIPTPPLVQAAKTLDPKAYDAYNSLSAVRPDPMDTSDRVVNILAQMAQGARGAKNLGDFFLGMGGGAAAGASANIKGRRAEDFQFARDQMEMNKFKADVGVRKAGAVADQANAQVAADNTNAQRQWQTVVQQSELDAAAKNRAIDHQFSLDLKKAELGTPTIKFDADTGNVFISQRTPDGGFKISTEKFGGAGGTLEKIAKQTEQLGKIFPGGGPASDILKYQTAGNLGFSAAGHAGAKEYITQQVISDIVTHGGLPEILGEEQFKKLDTEAKKGIPAGIQGTEKYTQAYNSRMFDLIRGQREALNSEAAKKGTPSFDDILAQKAIAKFGPTSGPGIGASLLLRRTQ